MNLCEALRLYKRVYDPELLYGWFAYDDKGYLKRYGISGSEAEVVATHGLLSRDTYVEYKDNPKLSLVLDS